MRINDARIHPYRLPLKRPWISARGQIDYREGWLISLHNEAGITGWGDCAPLEAAGTESLQQARQVLDKFIRHLPGREPDTLLAELGSLPPATRCGMETALLDLQARVAGCPLAELLGGIKRTQLRINLACGNLNNPVRDCIGPAADQGFEVIKLKIGVAEPEQEAARLQALAAQTDGRIGFRLDANGAWDSQQARRFIEATGGIRIESIEEPLSRADHGQMTSLQQLCPYPLALDESLAGCSPDDLPDLPQVRRLVLKPTVLGGPRNTLAWAQRAEAAGMQTVITSTLESAVGIAMAASCAATLDTDRAHGLGTGEWFETDMAPPLIASAGIMRLPEGNGIGLQPDIKL